MAIEIERKFLVTGEEWRAHADSGTAMSQGYLSTQEKATVRVRVSADSAKLTIKGPSEGIARAEYEYEIPDSDAREMLAALCVGEPVSKTRYRVEHGRRVWEVDVFEGANAGLVLAEIEIESPDEAVDLPSWVGEEVSGDARYFNACLARNPFSTWGR